MHVVYLSYLVVLAIVIALNLKYKKPRVCALLWTGAILGFGLAGDIPFIEFMLSSMAFPAFLIFSPGAFFFLSEGYEQTHVALVLLACVLYLFSWLWLEVILKLRQGKAYLVSLILFPPTAFVLWIPAFLKKKRVSAKPKVKKVEKSVMTQKTAKKVTKKTSQPAKKTTKTVKKKTKK